MEELTGCRETGGAGMGDGASRARWWWCRGRAASLKAKAGWCGLSTSKQSEALGRLVPHRCCWGEEEEEARACRCRWATERRCAIEW